MRVRKEKVDEGFGLAFKPVDPDEGLVDVARLVPSVVVVLGKVGIVVGPRGGLGVLAEEAPQSVVHDLVVGLVPTCACPGGDLREDVVRQRRSESFLPTAIMQPSVPVGEEFPSLAVPDGSDRVGPREQGSLSSSLRKDLFRDGIDHLGPVDVQEPRDLQ